MLFGCSVPITRPGSRRHTESKPQPLQLPSERELSFAPRWFGLQAARDGCPGSDLHTGHLSLCPQVRYHPHTDNGLKGQLVQSSRCVPPVPLLTLQTKEPTGMVPRVHTQCTFSLKPSQHWGEEDLWQF